MVKDNTPYKILIVEDNPGDLAIVEEFLAEQISDAFIVHALDFKKASAILTANNLFDVILLDLTLPDKSGEDLIIEMLQVALCPVIILSGYTDIEFSIKSIGLGIMDYLPKDDLNGTALYKSILYAIERRRTMSELKESEQRYSDLFHLSPQPMWVFDLETSCFLDVNNAAINNYGYSREEFLTITTRELMQGEDIHNPEADGFNPGEHEHSFLHDIVRHKKKDGELMHVSIESNFILFKGKKASLVLAKDITDRIKYITTIKEQNKKLKEIAWTQSHIVRAPLARMMAIVNLIEEMEIASPECADLLNHFNNSGKELDSIIKDIAEKTACININ